MKMLPWALVLAFSATSTFALASEPSALRALRKLAPATAAAKKKHIAPQCVNFAGNWQGTCTYSDGTSDTDTLLVTQTDCTSINLGYGDIPINGTLGIQSVPSVDSTDLSAFGAVSYAWNDAQTRLNSIVSMIAGAGVIAAATESGMWLTGDQLHVKDTQVTPVLSIGGTLNPSMPLSDCTYDRVQGS